MAILSLCTASFRNLADAEINTSVKDVFLVGENGQGKTNFLEALYFCAYASSFRGVKDGDMARTGEPSFSASAVLGSLTDASVSLAPDCRDIHVDPVASQLVNYSGPPPRGEPSPLRSSVEYTMAACITVKVEKTRKSINLDGKKIEDRKDLLELVPCVAFCHEDMDFVSGSQERRRWFFDQSQSLHDPVYLDDLRRYRRVLKSRNAVLKEAKTGGNYRRTAELLDVLDPQLAGYGIRLMEKRRTAAEGFSAVFTPLYREVSGIGGIGIMYVPSWKKADDDNFSQDMVVQRLAERRQADYAQGISLSGPHRDRYLFLREREPAEFSFTASTGQRRLLALLLRVAQAECFSGLSGKAPVLLLDDVLLELDGEKRRRFLSVMPSYEQAFFTFLPEEPYKNYGKADTLVYKVANGVISR